MSNGVRMTLDRTYVVRSTQGHAIRFEKGVPTLVPKAMLSAAMSIGAVLAEGEVATDILPKEVVSTTPKEPAERVRRISEAIKLIIEKNERFDFRASGIPTPGAVSREAGFRVDMKEVEFMYRKYFEEKAGEQS